MSLPALWEKREFRKIGQNFPSLQKATVHLLLPYPTLQSAMSVPISQGYVLLPPGIMVQVGMPNPMIFAILLGQSPRTTGPLLLSTRTILSPRRPVNKNC